MPGIDVGQHAPWHEPDVGDAERMKARTWIDRIRSGKRFDRPPEPLIDAKTGKVIRYH